MVKKRFLTACAAGIALVSVVGVGFSAWTFSNQSRVDLNSNVFITHANTFGEFNKAQAETGGNVEVTACIKLDQPTKDASGNWQLGTGISLVASAQETAAAVDKVTAEWTVSYASYRDTLKTSSSDIKILTESQIEYAVIIYIQKATLGKYVKVGGDYKDFVHNEGLFRPATGSHDHRKDYYAYKLSFTPSATAPTAGTSGVQVTVPDAAGPVKAAFTLDAASIPFTWFTENEAISDTETAIGMPKTFDDYTNMVKNLGCTGVSAASDVKGGQTYQTANNSALVIIEFCVFNAAKPTL